MKRVTGRAALATAAVLAGSWLLVLVLGVSIPLNALRTPIEAALSRTLDQVVSIEGPIAVRPTLGPSVTVHNLRIAARPGAGGMARLRAGQVEARFSVLSLWRDRPRLVRLEVRDITVNLEHGGTGAGPSPFTAGHSDSRRPEPDWLAQPELELFLHNLVLNYRAGGPNQPLRLAFEQASGRLLPGQPLQLAVDGWLGPVPYVADLTLPVAATLLRPGAQWPWQAGMDLAGTRLQLQGTLLPPAAGQGPRINLDLQGDWTAAADAAPETAAGPAIAGKLSLHIKGGRPHVSGELRLARLDMERLAGLVASGTMPVSAAVSTPGWLEAVDSALVVTVDEISGAPVAVHGIRANLVLRDGQLDAPLDTVIAGVPFHGSVRLDTHVQLPVLGLSLVAADFDVATLLHSLPGVAGFQGQVARAVLHATVPAGGKTGGVAGVDAGMRVSGARLSYGNTPGSLPVPVVLDELVLSVPAGEAMILTVQGALDNAPIAVELTGGSLEALRQEMTWPASLSATGRGAAATASGTLASLRTSGDTTFNFKVAGARLGDLAPWLGVSACAAMPYTVQGQLVLAKNIGRLQFLRAQLGGTQLTGELDWSRDEQVPLLHAVLHADTLNPADVTGLLPVMSYAGGTDAARGIRLGLPVLPRPLVIANADIDLTVAHIAHSLVDIAELSFSGRLRNGVFLHSPFRARIGRRVLQGQLDTSGADTGVAFEISVDDTASGTLLERLFSSAVEWAGNAGVVPLRWFFAESLSEPAAQECHSADDASPGPVGQ